jgi:hypothetical protein
LATPRAVRYRCDLPAMVLAEGVSAETSVFELSEQGAFVAEAEPIAELVGGDTLELGLVLPDGAPWTATARVNRHGTTRAELRPSEHDHVTVLKYGLGVEFENLSEDALERLRDFLELLDSR